MPDMVSIIIPSYNAERTVASTIKALLNQNYPKNKYEIIIVDDGSKDRTKEIVKRFKKVRLIEQKHKGPATARNLGAKHAKGSILLFTDSDCIPDKNWIKNMVEPFKNLEIAGVSGTYRTLNKESLVARYVGYEIEERHERMKRQKYIDFIGTFSAGYRKNIFIKFGGFDEIFPTASGEDPELSFRIAKAGYKMVFQSKAFVYHSHPNSFLKYFRQQFYRAFWRNFLYFRRRHKRKILSDSYTGSSLITQGIALGLLILILFASILFYFNIPLLVALIALIFLISFVFNLNLFRLILKKDRMLAIYFPFIILLRDIFGILGVFAGFIKLLFRRMT